MKKLSLIILFCLFTAIALFGQEVKKRYKIERTDTPPTIDGIADDPAWERGTWTGDFWQFEPYDTKPPSQPTEFKLCFDDSFVYFVVKCYDSAPDSIINRMTRRDNVEGDYVGVMFDSYHDLRTSFSFFVSSSGVKMDIIHSSNGQSEDSTWDPIWHVKTQIYDWGWVAEAKIPFTQLRFNANSKEVWGFEVTRMIYRFNEMSIWNPIPNTAPGFVHLFGELDGLQGIKPRKQLDLTPFVVTGFDTYEEEVGNPFATGFDFKRTIGLDGKIGVTNNLTLDFTINPDFGQVEADPSEVNLSAFESYYEEKRPFFIEGKNITSFKTGIGDGDIGNDNLFYSRRIGRRPWGYPSLENGEYAEVPRQTSILGAAKLTGKTENGWSIGIIESVAAEEYAKIDSSGVVRKESVEPLTNYFVARLQKDTNKGNTIIGGMYTNTLRDLDTLSIKRLHKTAHTGGVDFTQFFDDKNWVFQANIGISHVEGSENAIDRTQTSSRRYFQRPDNDYVNYDPTRTSLSGHGGNIQFGKIGGNWNFMVFNLWKSPGYELNDLGYLRDADQILNVLWSGYNINKPFSIFRNMRFNYNMWNVWDFGGVYHGIGGNININTQFKNYWRLSTGVNIEGESQVNSFLRGGPAFLHPGGSNVNVFIATDDRKKLNFHISTNINNSFNESGQARRLSVGATYRPINTLRISLTPAYSESSSELQYMTSRSFGGSENYIFGAIDQKILSMSLRVNYNITPDLTIQYWGQPFLASGKYTGIKRITDPMAENFSDRYHLFTGTEISYDQINSAYDIDHNNDGTRDYSVGNPNFNMSEFLSNFVVRWEFVPGSTFYLVWSQTRESYSENGVLSFGEDIDDLFSVNKPYNSFLLKFSYRFGLR